MKKYISLLLTIVLLLSLCGCGGKESTEPDAAASPSAAAPAPTPEPTPTPDPKTTPEYHGTAAVQERGVLRVGVSSNSGVNYIIPDDPELYGELAGTRDGYVPAMCRRIAEELGVEAEFVEFQSLEAQLQAVTDGDVDLAADNFAITDERLALYEMTMDFSVVEIEGDEVFLSTKPQPRQEEGEADPPDSAAPAAPEAGGMIQGEEELATARIGVMKGSVQARNTAMQYPEAELQELPDNAAILEALVRGEVDAGVFTMMDGAFADLVVQAILDGDVAQCGLHIITPDYRGFGLILMKGNTELCGSIDTILPALKESGWLLECYNTENAEALEREII